MTHKVVVVVAGDRGRPELVARTCAALECQTMKCQALVVWTGSSPPNLMLCPSVELPQGFTDYRVAGGFGMQLAFNGQADVVTTLVAGDELEARTIEMAVTEIEASGADIVEVRDSLEAADLGTLFITAHVAYIAAVWAQIPDRMSPYFREVLKHVIEQQGMKLTTLYHPMKSLRERKPITKMVRGSKTDIIRSIYERTGITLSEVSPITIAKIKSVAVVTPYHKEPIGKLRRCHESVLQQGPSIHHFMIADGHPISELNSWKLTHIALPQAHADSGNTPRGLGAMLAFAQGFDAVAFLDADNWYADSHVKSMLRCQERSGARVVCAWRTVVLPDGTRVPRLDPEDARKSHVDTSCFLITKNVGFLGVFWAQMPQVLGPVCDRVYLAYARVVDPKLAWTEKQTVFFESNYSLHFRMAGRPLPERMHDIPRELKARIDPVEFKKRTGLELHVKGQMPVKWRA